MKHELHEVNILATTISVAPSRILAIARREGLMVHDIVGVPMLSHASCSRIVDIVVKQNLAVLAAAKGETASPAAQVRVVGGASLSAINTHYVNKAVAKAPPGSTVYVSKDGRVIGTAGPALKFPKV